MNCPSDVVLVRITHPMLGWIGRNSNSALFDKYSKNTRKKPTKKPEFRSVLQLIKLLPWLWVVWVNVRVQQWMWFLFFIFLRKIFSLVMRYVFKMMPWLWSYGAIISKSFRSYLLIHPQAYTYTYLSIAITQPLHRNSLILKKKIACISSNYP